jgi:sugar phosphate isomerase/epimerase
MARIALQLYTVRNELARDVVRTLERVSKMGYEGVELAGFFDCTPREWKRMTEALGLVPVSSHVPLERLEREWEQVLEEHTELGVKFLVLPWIPEERRTPDGYRRLAEWLEQAGEKAAEAGIRLGYHHHEFEFAPLDEKGTCGIELLMGSDSAKVFLEPDVYWAAFAGQDPVAFLRQHEGRCPLVHLKDMDPETREDAEIGAGGVDIQAVCACEQSAGVEWWIVEQDECRRPPLESVKASLERLRRLLGERSEKRP